MSGNRVGFYRDKPSAIRFWIELSKRIVEFRLPFIVTCLGNFPPIGWRKYTPVGRLSSLQIGEWRFSVRSARRSQAKSGIYTTYNFHYSFWIESSKTNNGVSTTVLVIGFGFPPQIEWRKYTRTDEESVSAVCAESIVQPSPSQRGITMLQKGTRTRR